MNRTGKGEPGQTRQGRCEIISLEKKHRDRLERLIGRQIEVLMFIGGYSLFDALRKAVTDYLAETGIRSMNLKNNRNNIFTRPSWDEPGHTEMKK